MHSKRFQLDATGIYARFPPINAQGHFHKTLPHLILNSPTYPWQRTIEGIEPPCNGDLTPWVTLLLFNEDEMQSIFTEIIPINQLTTHPSQTKADTVLVPKLALLPSEDPKQTCNIIDIPASIFSKIAPAQTELHYLAHARRTSVTEKTDQHLARALQSVQRNDTTTPLTELTIYNDFSVVVGNRLPQAGKRSVVHLVSLEGCLDFFPVLDNQGGYQENVSIKNPQKTTIRLISLTNWSFTVLNSAEDFRGALLALNQEPGSLQIPYSNSRDSQSSESQFVQNAFSMGYTGLNHQMRYGNQTVSWYRGPLVPYEINSQGSVTLRYADQANRYDPSTGMFDVSYAAAWQLGRQLAISDQDFSQHLFRWRQGIIMHTVSSIHRKQLPLLGSMDAHEFHPQHEGQVLEEKALDLLSSTLDNWQRSDSERNN